MMILTFNLSCVTVCGDDLEEGCVNSLNQSLETTGKFCMKEEDTDFHDNYTFIPRQVEGHRPLEIRTDERISSLY